MVTHSDRQFGIHGQRPHPLGRRGDVDAGHDLGHDRGTLPARQLFDGLPFAQGALDRGVEGVQAHAEELGGAVVAGQQVGRRGEPISGPTRPGSSPVMAAATRLPSAVMVTGRFDARAAEQQRVADALDELRRR